MTIHGASKFHVCGYHGTGTWRCTASETGLNKGSTYLVWKIGGNYRSWRRGLTEVYWNGGGAGNWDQCNTNGAYSGFAGYYYSSNGTYYPANSPNYVWLQPVGPGDPTC
jgi:hypothetical protein